MKQLSKIATTTFGLSLVAAPWAWSQTPSQATSGTPSKKFSVVIDPGHGGTDKGEDEKQSNLSLAFQLRAELEKRGMRVVLTRSKDEFLPLQERVDVANTIKPDCFISLHGQHEKRRPFSYILNYYNPDSALLAETLNKGLIQELKPIRKVELASMRYYVLRKPEVPSVMVTQNLDAASTPETQRKFVVALAEGIEDYAQDKGAPNKDVPNLGKLFKSQPKTQQIPKSTTPTSPMQRKPPSIFNYLSAKTGK